MARKREPVDPIECALCGRTVERAEYLPARGRCRAGWYAFMAGDLGACSPRTKLPRSTEQVPGR